VNERPREPLPPLPVRLRMMSVSDDGSKLLVNWFGVLLTAAITVTVGFVLILPWSALEEEAVKDLVDLTILMIPLAIIMMIFSWLASKLKL
jgi:membrane protein DedA with SNARE-associated domain